MLLLASILRGEALMDDNVMNTYTTVSTEPRHFVQYDQGEDRWLCTLLLQQGWRVEYSAASGKWDVQFQTVIFQFLLAEFIGAWGHLHHHLVTLIMQVTRGTWFIKTYVAKVAFWLLLWICTVKVSTRCDSTHGSIVNTFKAFSGIATSLDKPVF